MKIPATPGSLQEIGLRHDCGKMSGHSYVPVYEKFLGPLRNRPIRLLEIGIDQGCSLKAWLEYLPKAKIIGIDCGPFDAFTHPRLTTHVCNQQDPRIADLFPDGSLDVIIDDAGHIPEYQHACFHWLWPKLKPGGLYFVEDVPLHAHTSEILRPWSHVTGWQVFAGFRNGFGDFRDDDVLLMLPHP